MTAMPKRLCAFMLCLGLLAAARPAQAQGDDVKLSLCKQVLGRMLCKKQNEFGYMGKLEEGVFIISVFYASKNSEYLCAVMQDGQVIVQDRTWHPLRRVFPFTISSDGKCLETHVNSQDCPSRAPVRACMPKGPKDEQEKLKETFWSRPIPKILEEEYRAMTAKGQQNATAAPAEQPAPAAQ
jgi:hypothetical protein